MMVFQDMSLFLLSCVTGVLILCLCVVVARAALNSAPGDEESFTTRSSVDVALKRAGLYSGSDTDVAAAVQPVHDDLRKQYKTSFDLVQQRILNANRVADTAEDGSS